DDFREDPPKDWFRLAPGREVRLRYACLIRCTGVVKDDKGEVVELRCTWDPESWGGAAPDGRVVRGTLHWVSAAHALPIEARLYDRLFSVENPGTTEGRSFLDEVNPASMLQLTSCLAEPYLGTAGLLPGARLQFERLGYFCLDPASAADKQIWNRTVTLKDSWAKLEAKAGAGARAGGKTAAPKTSPQPTTVPVSSAAAVASVASAPAVASTEIGIEDLARVDLRVGIVREAAHVPEAKKLIRLMVDIGEGRLRQIFAGLRAFYPDPSVLLGQRVIVVANLKPRQMKFGLSEGMILAAGGGDRPHRVATFDGADLAAAPQPGDKIA
ncbi:MAG: hypothetical protein H7X95_12110, partial [Deltaproteobacteria bacterium]|nr:hypothetical protein [Deltaproteobacteria bacterium]